AASAAGPGLAARRRVVAIERVVAHRICELADLPDPGSRAFSAGSGPWPLRGFLVRRGNEVFGYVNRCPHAGHPLNLRPDQFLSADNAAILCNSHGAMFDIASGACWAGPCVGAALKKLPIVVRDGHVLL